VCAGTPPPLAACAGDPREHAAACYFPVAEGDDLALASREARAFEGAP
jgi:hypothetical protein